MTLLHAVALHTYEAGSGTFAWVHEVCLEWKHVAALRAQDSFQCTLNTEAEPSIFPVTHVDMVYGKTYILKHPYKELLKAFVASRGET